MMLVEADYEEVFSEEDGGGRMTRDLWLMNKDFYCLENKVFNKIF